MSGDENNAPPAGMGGFGMGGGGVPLAHVCETCGAMLALGWRQVHADWHHENDHDHRNEQG